MDNWYKVRLSFSASIPIGEGMKLQHAYTEIFIANGAPKDALVLANTDCTDFYDYYFSPGAMRIASDLVLSHGGVLCSRPQRKDVRLAVGDVNSLDQMLPEGDSS